MNTRGETRIPYPHAPDDQESARLQKESGHDFVIEDASSADRDKLSFTPKS